MEFREKENGVTFAVRVQPRASRSEIAGERGGALKLRLAAPPVDGAANAELISFLAKRFGISRSQIIIISGLTSKNKVIRITGITIREAEEALRH